MLRQVFHVESFWKVIVYFDVDYSLFSIIANDLINSGIKKGLLKQLYHVMSSNQAKAVTFSNTADNISIILFNNHSSWSDYLNSLVHEAEHVKQAMLKKYKVKDSGEPPAYTIGYLVMRLWEAFQYIT